MVILCKRTQIVGVILQLIQRNAPLQNIINISHHYCLNVPQLCVNLRQILISGGAWAVRVTPFTFLNITVEFYESVGTRDTVHFIAVLHEELGVQVF